MHGELNEHAMQLRNLEMNASSDSSLRARNMPIILDGSKKKASKHQVQLDKVKDEAYASCPSGSQSVRSTRSGILA